MAPSATDSGTAEGLGAHDATELSLTHLIVDLSEAGSCPVVSLALRASETIDTGTSVGPDASPSILAAILTHRLSTVTSSVAFLTRTGVLCTATSVHTADVTRLNSYSCTTAGGELAVGAGTHVGSGAEAIATRISADRDDALVPSGQSLPAGTAVGVETRAADIGTSECLLASASNPLHFPLLSCPSEAAGLVCSSPCL